MTADSILQGLVELVKAGGPLALWGIFIWLFLGLLRIVTVCLVIYLVARLVSETIRECYKISKETSCKKVSLLSEEVSQKLSTALTSLTETVKTACQDLKRQAEESLKSAQRK